MTVLRKTGETNGTSCVESSPRPYEAVFYADSEEILGFFEEYRFLSNFHETPIVHRGLTFGSTEAAFQAAKFDDIRTRCEFCDKSPSEAKKLGRKIRMSKEEISAWNEERDSVMLEVTLLKYMDLDLRARLVATRGRYLEETNYWNDTYWGVCNKVGQNKLGSILMTVRDLWFFNY